MTDSDRKLMIMHIEAQKDQFVYFALTNKIFRAILNNQFKEATAIISEIYNLNPDW